MTEQTGPVRLRKRPVVIEAMQFDGSYDSGLAITRWVNGLAADKDTCELHSEPGSGVEPKPWHLEILTLEGRMRADAGWWVARGVEGEFYPIKPTVVEATYEPESAVGLGKPGSQVPLDRTNFDQVVRLIDVELADFLTRHRDQLFHGINALSPHTQLTVLSRVAEALAGSGIVWRDHTERLELLEKEDGGE